MLHAEKITYKILLLISLELIYKQYVSYALVLLTFWYHCLYTIFLILFSPEHSIYSLDTHRILQYKIFALMVWLK